MALLTDACVLHAEQPSLRGSSKVLDVHPQTTVLFMQGNNLFLKVKEQKRCLEVHSQVLVLLVQCSKYEVGQVGPGGLAPPCQLGPLDLTQLWLTLLVLLDLPCQR
jgi:hypothetical protein